MGERRELNPRMVDPQSTALIHLATSAPIRNRDRLVLHKYYAFIIFNVKGSILKQKNKDFIYIKNVYELKKMEHPFQNKKNSL